MRPVDTKSYSIDVWKKILRSNTLIEVISFKWHTKAFKTNKTLLGDSVDKNLY